MSFKLTRPCDNCPFRKEGGIRLHPERAREIANNAIRAQGATFMCHKTVTHDDDGEHAPTESEQYCAGALAFALNVGSLNQYMRIMQRLRAWRPDEIKDRHDVFSSVHAMVRASTVARRGSARPSQRAEPSTRA